MEHYTVITGASSGIGETLAIELAKKKVNLLLIARRKELLEQLSFQLRQLASIKVEILTLDLSEYDAADKVIKFINDKKICVNYVYNNAGIGFYNHLVDTTPEQIQKTIDLNITALSKLSWAFMRYWKQNKIPAHLINISSVAAYVPLEFFVIYAASKAYVKSFSLALRVEAALQNVKVSCVCPGGTKTKFFESSGQNISPLGQKFLMPVEECVQIILKGVEHNFALIVPGISNKLSVLLSKVIPDYFFAYLSSKFFTKLMK